MQGKKLTKDSSRKMIFGVCSGIGNYFDVDPTIVRLAWAASCIFGGLGIFAYIIAAIIIPDDER